MNSISIYELLAVEGLEGEGASITPDSPVTETTTTTEPTPVTETPVSEIDIDGEKFTLDDVKSWRQGNMTTSEYMTKMQEVEQMKTQYKDAVELFDYLKGKPDLAKKLYELDSSAPTNKIPNPTDERIANLERQLQINTLENELKIVMSKDKYGANEMDVLKLATDNRTSIENAYKLWLGSNTETIIQKQLADNSKKLTENIKNNNVITKTVISDGDKSTPPDASYGLSQVEVAMAERLGMTAQEYAKWK